MGVIAAAVSLFAALFVQTLTFEVASIKPEKPSMPGTRNRISFACKGTDGPGDSVVPIGRCVGTNIELARMITYAYDLEGGPDYLAGAPSWSTADRYAVEAKSESPATHRQLKLMLQELLLERFKLKFHHEAKEVDGFELVISSGGSKLKVATGDEDNPGGHFNPMSGLVTANNVPMRDLADFLAIESRHPVIDKTGLPGNYNYSFTMPVPQELGSTVPEASLFTVVQEQPGLKLVSAKVPISVFVIDSYKKPQQ